MIPENAPEALHWLFTESQPGTRISYSFRCPYGQAIYKHHKDLPEVQAYSKMLASHLTDPWADARTTKLGAKKILTAKSAMVDAVLRHYGCFRVGSKKQLRQRIAELESELAKLKGA